MLVVDSDVWGEGRAGTLHEGMWVQSPDQDGPEYCTEGPIHTRLTSSPPSQVARDHNLSCLVVEALQGTEEA